jgi:hypothetical protein
VAAPGAWIVIVPPGAWPAEAAPGAWAVIAPPGAWTAEAARGFGLRGFYTRIYGILDLYIRQNLYLLCAC